MGRGRVRVGERAQAAKSPGSVPRGPGPASSVRFPYPKAGGVPVPERAAGTITAPVRGTARAMDMETDPVEDLAAALVAVAGMASDRGAAKGADTDLGPMTPTAPMTAKVTRTATVTATVRLPRSPSTCGRSSGRF
jgi:hypothetical protein